MTSPEWTDDRVYGRRQDKPLRTRHSNLMSDLLPQVAVTPDTVKSIVAAHQGDVWLEVGFGGGEHLAWHAAQNPDVLMIGAEPFINGVAKLLALIDEYDLKNVRVCHGDVRPLMAAIPDRRLSRMFVLHPDPWPKSRHFKRRMISAPFLAHAARLLQTGSELRVASDIPDYVRWTLMRVQIHNRWNKDFQWTANRKADWTNRPEDWPQTRYEKKAIREGRPPAYLKFARCG
ncbi:tRNA (guanine(46)-N(7))-methyltransferase TrmB [Parvularcula sp. LCG005]|uniref:tRNA (guanine(46)-N(7))-methyltransferase TrmB n=1 Tax=Parvularcula sp. LCG005 TaxID=3078805 RepID=UPI002943E2A1|nr:tRNA (guanine(46)-N(7))-methyltransferase TrmB [Parvularcula sp. LCG005]WOI53344.1 tRNA (guanine(46)-N(7))-methyltransferase TrmB [Parvularcula sp. LCG005]